MAELRHRPHIGTPGQIDYWLGLFATRDEFAEEYASLLQYEPPEWDGWKAVNEAILRRWSPNALRYIKEKAWKVAG